LSSFERATITTFMISKNVYNPYSFKDWLQSEFTTRCNRNSRYSLRSFSQLLKMDASSVSQILSGRRKVTARVMRHICSQLEAEKELTEAFVRECSYRPIKKLNALSSNAPQSEYHFIDEDSFNLMSNWYYLAILELAYVIDLKNDPLTISNIFSLNVIEVKIALERIMRLGLLIEENGILKRTNRLLTTFIDGQTSAAHKQLQHQILTLGIKALDTVPQNEKDITAMTMAIDESKLPKAREMIKKFRRDLCDFLEDGKKDKVFQLSIQLFPLSKTIDN
jgi:uncharacterized protein (TIGR02147 family)